MSEWHWLWFISPVTLQESAKFTLKHLKLKNTSWIQSETARLCKIELITHKNSIKDAIHPVLDFQCVKNCLTGAQRQIDVDSTWILYRYVEDQISTKFHVLFWCNFADWKIQVISTYFFQCNFDDAKTHVVINFDGRKIRLVSTYFYRCHFAVRNIYVVSTYFFWCNFDGRKTYFVSTQIFWCNFSDQKIHIVFTYFFRCKFDGRKIHVVCAYLFRRNFDGQKFGVVFG